MTGKHRKAYTTASYRPKPAPPQIASLRHYAPPKQTYIFKSLDCHWHRFLRRYQRHLFGAH
jgi:hypothetical protein